MDIASVTMEWFYDKFDVGGGRKVDEVVDSDYGYLLRISAIYPYLRNGYTVLGLTQIISYVAILAWGLYVLIETTILVSSEDMNLAAQYAHFGILYFMAITMMFAANKNRHRFNYMHLIVRDNYYQYDDGVEIKEQASWNIELRQIKIKLVLAIPAYLAATTFSIVGFPLIDVYLGFGRNEIKGLDMRLPIPLSHPFSKDNPVIFGIYFLLTLFSSFVATAVISSVDILCIFICLPILYQYKKLHKSIEQLQQRAESIFKIRYPKQRKSEKKMKSCYMYCIKQNVEHHLKIEAVFKEFFNMAYLPVGLGILLGSFIIAASLLGYILGDAPPSLYASSSLLVFGEIANIGMLCYFGQEIKDHSYATVTALYNANWNTAPKAVVKSVLIMTEKSKRPLEAKAFGIWPLNFELFSSIINTAYSYFNVLLGAKASMRLKH